MAHFRVDPSVCFTERDSWVFLKKNPNKRPASGRFGRSNGKALHRYRRGQAGFESRTSLYHFRLNLNATGKVVSITEMTFFHLKLPHFGNYERMAFFSVSQGLIHCYFYCTYILGCLWCTIRGWACITFPFQKNSNHLCRICVPFCISFLLHDSRRKTYPSPQK